MFVRDTKGPSWTAKQSKDFDTYWSDYLPPVMWKRIMGLEETLQILTPEGYERDKEYLEILNLVKTYIQKRK